MAITSSLTTRDTAEGELFRLMLENVRDYAIFVKDPEGHVKSWNPGAERLLGYSEAEILGQSASLFYTPEDNAGDIPRREMEHAVKTGRCEDIRWHVRKDGSRFWSGGTLTPLWDAEHKLQGFAKILRDRSVQKKNDEALKNALAFAEKVVEERREIETHFTSLVKNVKDHAIITIDTAGNITSGNLEAERILGYPEAELRGQHFSAIFTSEDTRDGIPEHELRLARDEGRAVNERWHLRRGGENFWALGIVTPTSDAEGHLTGYSNILRDMTEQKLAEQELQKTAKKSAIRAREHTAELQKAHVELQKETAERQRTQLELGLFRALIDHTLDIIEVIDPDTGQFLDVNDTACLAHGYTREEFLNLSVRDITSANISKQWGEWIQEYPHPIQQFESVHRRKDGSTFPVEVSFNVIALDRPYMIAVVRDITVRKRSEEAMRESEARFRALFESNMLGTFFWTEEGEVTEANEAFLSLIGFSKSDIRNGIVSWVNLTPPECYARDKAALAEIASTGRCAPYEKDYIHKDGRRISILLGAASLPGSDHGVAFAIDLRERKKVENDRDDLLKRLQLHIERLPLAYLLCGPDMRYARWNPAAERMFGFTETEILGKHPFDVIVPKESQEFVGGFLELLRAGDMNCHGVSENKKADGTMITCEWHNTPLMVEGEFIGLISIAQDITARREVEKELLLRDRAIRATTQGIMITDAGLPDNPIVYASPAALRQTGYGSEELLGRNCRFLQGKETDPVSVEIIRAAIRNGEACNVELLNYRKDGTPFWNSLSIDPIQDPAGRLTHFVAVQTDITLRRQLEEQYRRSQNRLQYVVASSPVVLFTLAVQAEETVGLSWISENLWSVLGYRPEMATEPGWWRGNIHPEDRDNLLAKIRSELFALGRTSHEYRFRHGDGTYRWMRDEMRLTRDEDGRAMEAIGSWSDINDRKLAEEHRARLVEVLEATPDFVGISDADHHPIFLNRAARRMVGLEVEGDVSGTMFNDYYPAWAAAILVEKAIPQALKTGTWEGESALLTQSGKEIPVSQVIVVSKTTGGAVRTISTIIRDLTEKKKLEQQFRQAQKMEAFGQLAGGVAHDFNNLLTIISGYSEIVMQNLTPADENREMIEEIQKASQRAAMLTKQLLAFSRKQVMQFQVLDLNTVVTGAEKMLARLIGEDIILSTRLANGLDRVKVDPGQIEQVIMNLVVNARDAMPTGGRITLETANVPLDANFGESHAEVIPGHYVMLAVNDNGCGMTDDVKRHLFEPFFTTKAVGLGTGLGLATVFGIVKQSGGHVRVYSELGHGTTFKIYLPSYEEISPTNQTKAESKTIPRGTETILLVEDEKALRMMTRTVLLSQGYSVLEAADGADAIRICEQREEPIHLLISDVVMPQLGGRQLSDRLVTLIPDMRVLFVSGYTDDAVVRHGVLEAEVQFLQKPFTVDALGRKVREVLDAPRQS